MRRVVWLAVSGASLGVGMVGVVVPLLPTTPFVLLAVWAAARSSPRLHKWLLNHPTFGRVIHEWNRTRRIPPTALAAAAASVTISVAVILSTI